MTTTTRNVMYNPSSAGLVSAHLTVKVFDDGASATTSRSCEGAVVVAACATTTATAARAMAQASRRHALASAWESTSVSTCMDADDLLLIMHGLDAARDTPNSA